uniref:Calponin-homology (CH) domain-containing protein n=1 Tax=Megaselia scalaris TaxID=36166 RepID=T1GKR0_MEGSC
MEANFERWNSFEVFEQCLDLDAIATILGCTLFSIHPPRKPAEIRRIVLSKTANSIKVMVLGVNQVMNLLAFNKMLIR